MRVLLAVAATAVVAIILGATPASANDPNATRDSGGGKPPTRSTNGSARIAAAVAGGCWNDGCNYKYYNYGGPSCTDAYLKSPIERAWSGSTTEYWMEVRYSPACGAAFTYVHDITPQPGMTCYMRLYRSLNSGNTWDHLWSERVEPGLNIAYTVMMGDYDWNKRVAGRVYCRNGSLSYYSQWVKET